MEYYPWLKDDEDDAFAWIDVTPKSLMDKEYRLKIGAPAKDWFPTDTTYELCKDRGVKLTDSIPNNLRLLFVSERLKTLLEKEAASTAIEFLPVRLKNQRKQFVDKPYYIANVLDCVSCMEREKSDFVMDSLVKDQVFRFRRLVLDEGRLPEDKKLFRLGEKKDLFIIREDLAQAILNADMNGMMFIPMEDYGADFRART